MIDMSGWPRLRLNVLTDVSLDPDNVRLAEGIAAASEADVISDLVTNEGVLDLVDGIVRVGYLTHELPVVVRDVQAAAGWNEYRVVEGNRRLAALKLIQNPRLSPTVQGKVDVLTRGFAERDQLQEVEFILAPDMDAANQLIAAIHTSNLRKPWQPARQAAFFQAQLADGHTYSELKRRYPTINVEEFVLYAQLRLEMEKVARSSSELESVLGKTSWKRSYSTLSRIFDAKIFQEICDSNLDDRGKVVSRLGAKQRDAVWRVILGGILDETLNTRTLNSVKSARFKQLITELETAIADADDGSIAAASPDILGGRSTGSRSGSGTGSGVDGGSQGTARSGSAHESGISNAGEQAAKTPKRSRRQSQLPIDHLGSFDGLEVGVARILTELCNLNVRTHTTIAHVALRTALERAIKAFAEHKGENLRSRLRKKDKQFLQLGDALEFLESYLNEFGPNGLIQPVKKLRANTTKDYMLSLDSLNASCHNPNFQVSAEEVLEFWDSIEGLMKELIKR